MRTTRRMAAMLEIEQNNIKLSYCGNTFRFGILPQYFNVHQFDASSLVYACNQSVTVIIIMFRMFKLFTIKS